MCALNPSPWDNNHPLNEIIRKHPNVRIESFTFIRMLLLLDHCIAIFSRTQIFGTFVAVSQRVLLNLLVGTESPPPHQIRILWRWKWLCAWPLQEMQTNSLATYIISMYFYSINIISLSIPSSSPTHPQNWRAWDIWFREIMPPCATLWRRSSFPILNLLPFSSYVSISRSYYMWLCTSFSYECVLRGES